MATPLEPKKINVGTYGLMRQASVDDTLMPEGVVTEVQNFHFDRLGVATTRLGIKTLASTSVIQFNNANPCLGLHNMLGTMLLAAFYKSDVTRTVLYFHNNDNNNLWVQNANVTAIGGSAKIRFVDFADRTILLTGTADSLLVLRSLSASPTTGTGNPINLTQFMDGGGTADRKTASFGEVYKSRVYLAGDASGLGISNYTGKPSRLYISSVIDTSGNISWNPTVDYVDINPGDGEDITGLKRYSLELDIFKPNYIYRFRTSGLDPDPLIKIGTRSHESIVEGKTGLYFHHDTGFYQYSGGYPKEISRAIVDFVDSIPVSQRDDIIGWKDNDHIYWSLGNLTIKEVKESVLWRNVVVRYTESTDLWTIFSYKQDIRRGVPYVTKTSSSISVGLDNGMVALFNEGNTDIDEPIKYRLVTKWYDWGNILERKTIQELGAVAEKSREAQLMYQTDENLEWQGIGQLKKLVNIFNKQNIEFNRVRFKITGTNKLEQMTFQGLLIAKGQNQGMVYAN